MLHRRTVIAGLAAGSLVPTAVAQSVLEIGATKLRTFSDGHMMVGLDRLAAAGADPAVLTAALGGAAQPRFALNVVLIERDGKRILIDAGAGGTWVDTAGKLGDTLTASGIDAASIDQVIFTHGHPDHLWGVIDDFDNSVRFPRATFVLPKAEFDFWMSPGKAEQSGAAEGVTAGARRILKMIEPKLKLASSESAIAPGIAYLDMPGHTPGQCAVLVSTGSSYALIAADTLFHPLVSVRHPDWQPAQDMDGVVAARSRRKLLDIAAQSKALVIAYHIDGAGRVEKTGTGHVWQPA